MPDEVFLRLRGSLFFGPEFRVTRNKLSFRDNLQELLATANPGTEPAFVRTRIFILARLIDHSVLTMLMHGASV